VEELDGREATVGDTYQFIYVLRSLEFIDPE